METSGSGSGGGGISVTGCMADFSLYIFHPYGGTSLPGTTQKPCKFLFFLESRVLHFAVFSSFIQILWDSATVVKMQIHFSLLSVYQHQKRRTERMRWAYKSSLWSSTCHDLGGSRLRNATTVRNASLSQLLRGRKLSFDSPVSCAESSLKFPEVSFNISHQGFYDQAESEWIFSDNSIMASELLNHVQIISFI